MPRSVNLRMLRMIDLSGKVALVTCDTCLFRINSITGIKKGWFILGQQDFCSVKCLLKSLLDTRRESLIDSASVSIMESE